MKKLLAITVTVIMVMLCLVPCAFAAGDSVTVSMVKASDVRASYEKISVPV